MRANRQEIYSSLHCSGACDTQPEIRWLDEIEEELFNQREKVCVEVQ